MVRIFLIANAIGFIVFGAAAFLWPVDLANSLGIVAGGPHGVYEVRGVYGGVSIAAGFLYALGGFSASYTRPALLFLMVYTGGYFAARIAALPFDGAPEPYFMAFVAYEGVTAALSAFFLMKISRTN